MHQVDLLNLLMRRRSRALSAWLTGICSFARRSRVGQSAVGVLLALSVVASAVGPVARTAAATPAAPIDPSLQQQMAASPTQLLPVIVEMQRSSLPTAGANVQLAQQALNLLQLNGTAQVALPLIDSAAGLAAAAGINAISATPGVAYIHPDAAVRAHSGSSLASGLGTAYPRAVNADRAWGTGRTGKGVTVAVLDSGIALDADLTQPTSRILTAVNFADPLGTSPDPGGHGTHVAGTIAGNGTRSAGQYVGIAPGANLVDVRVLDGNGNGRTSSVVLGVQWALAHRVQYNIRVLNLSLGAPTPGSYRLDPLAAAVEIAWARGLVVVAAAGNTGGAVDSPGADPYVLTVGATDDRETSGVADDLVGWFSSSGTPTGSSPKPDVVAPGRRIVSLRVPGSTLDRLMPDHVVTASNGASYFRLTGTSMATAVVSGAVALLLEQQPALTPDQVKAIVKGTTQPFGQASGTAPNPSAIGSGLIDAYAALGSGARGPANRGQRPSDGTARSLYPALYGQPLTWIDPTYAGIAWGAVTWSNLAWDNLAWDNFAWDSVAWSNIAWDNLAWDNFAWDGAHWGNLAWDDFAWDSQRLD
jgi:serine protease AprX